MRSTPSGRARRRSPACGPHAIAILFRARSAPGSAHRAPVACDGARMQIGDAIAQAPEKRKAHRGGRAFRLIPTRIHPFSQARALRARLRKNWLGCGGRI
ncbi:hypothetical protein A8H35_16895 [Burkholderia thailandensis]|nr:hypothetical protein A8H35_16895 [Burkholderia thailandensis]AWY69092.1 hypothetical protein A8H36_30365 [Burkholderia thailandensis]PHH38158.1 hypothetical protein CRX59_17235 [Burkholderia thailandensis]